MPYCTAIGCKNKSSSKSKAQLEYEKHSKITFHCFPKNTDKQKVWIDCMGLTKAALPKYPYLCSCHFSNESFDRTSACKIRLRDNAVPSASKVPDKPSIATSQDAVVLQEISNTSIDIETIKIELSGSDELLTVNGVQEQRRIKLEIVNSPKDYGTKDASTETERPPQSVNKGTWVSTSFIGDSPTNIYLRNMIKNQKVAYERKIKLLKQTIRRKDKRIASLKDSLPEFKKKNTKQLKDSMTQTLSTPTKNPLKRIRKKV